MIRNADETLVAAQAAFTVFLRGGALLCPCGFDRESFGAIFQEEPTMATQNQGQGQGKRSGTENRGFASMSPEEQREIARMGGEAVSEDREHMAQIGRKGGEASAEARAAARNNRGAGGASNERSVGQQTRSRGTESDARGDSGSQRLGDAADSLGREDDASDRSGGSNSRN